MVTAFLMLFLGDLLFAVLVRGAFVTLDTDGIARPETDFFITEPEGVVDKRMKEAIVLCSAANAIFKSLFAFEVSL